MPKVCKQRKAKDKLAKGCHFPEWYFMSNARSVGDRFGHIFGVGGGQLLAHLMTHTSDPANFKYEAYDKNEGTFRDLGRVPGARIRFSWLQVPVGILRCQEA